MRFIQRFFRDSDAATAVEYAVMLAMILMAIIATVGVVGAQSGGMWGGIQSNMSSHGMGGS